MLKITAHKSSNSARLTLEGRLTGPWVNELERVWQTVRPSVPVPPEVDLTGVTFVAEEGRALLNRMWQQGAVFIAEGCCTGHMVDEITGARRGRRFEGSEHEF